MQVFNGNDNAYTRPHFDTDTAKYISDYSGTVRRFDPILQLGGGIMVRPTEEQAVLPEHVLT